MKAHYLLVAAFLLTVVAVSAAPKKADTVLTAVDITGYVDGDYTMSLKGGTVTIRPFNLLTPGQPPPNPTPTPTPNPGPLNARAKLFQDAAGKVSGDPSKVDNAKTLAVTYRACVTNAPAGMTQNQLKELVGKATDALLPSNAQVPWQPVRTLLGTEWTKLDLSSSKFIEYENLLNDAADGIEASAPQKSLDPVTLQKIIDLIMMLIKIFYGG